MEVTGKIIVALPEMSGTSKMGNPWKKREYVLETLESFPKKIHFDFFGEKADQFILNPGDTIWEPCAVPVSPPAPAKCNSFPPGSSCKRSQIPSLKSPSSNLLRQPL